MSRFSQGDTFSSQRQSQVRFLMSVEVMWESQLDLKILSPPVGSQRAVSAGGDRSIITGLSKCTHCKLIFSPRQRPERGTSPSPSTIGSLFSVITLSKVHDSICWLEIPWGNSKLHHGIKASEQLSEALFLNKGRQPRSANLWEIPQTWKTESKINKWKETWRNREFWEGEKKNKIISVIYSETGYIYKITHTLKSIFLKSWKLCPHKLVHNVNSSCLTRNN